MNIKALVVTVVAVALGATLLAQDQARERKLQQAIDLLETKGDAARAMPLLEEVAKSADQFLAARGLLYLGQAQERQGNTRARATYERIVREFASQQQVVTQARSRLAALIPAGAVGTATVTSRLIAKIERPAYALGTMSRDGRYLPLVDKNDAWLLDLTTGTRRLLIPKDTEREVYVEGVVLSPDGKLMAYAGSSDKTNTYELRIGTIGGGGKDSRRVISGELNWIDPVDFSPDGTSLLVSIQRESRGPIELVLISTRDGAIQALGSPRPVGGPTRAAFSPDGRFIAAGVPAGSSTASDIAIFDVSSRRQIPIVVHRAHDVLVGWSPDGSRIAFTSDRGGENGLWTQRIRNGEPDGVPERIRADIGQISPIGITSSGAVYSSEGFRPAQPEVQTAVIDFAAGRFVVPPSADGRQCNASAMVAPDYSADGQFLGYLCIRRSAGPQRRERCD